MPIIWYINAHKILIFPVVLGLMFYYGDWGNAAFVYLGMHGAYSVIWIMKSTLFPDKRFADRVPLWIGILLVFLPLASYYAAPFLLTSRHVDPPAYVYALAVATFTIGVFFHYVGDAQKFYTMRLQPGLIEDGLFSRTRNPNYLGEVLIYSGFALMSWHWLPFAVIAAWVFGFFLRNMRAKDRSLSRHAGFTAYRSRTGLLLPKIV